ncbi:MAG: DUF4962 domain-containing protein, partial [Armatimonadota bacterium]
ICLALAAPLSAVAQDTIPLGEVIEAETLNAVNAAEEDRYAEDASGGAYVFLPEPQMDSSGELNSYVEVPIADFSGQFIVRVRAYAPSTGTDSLHFHWPSGHQSMGLDFEPPAWRWYEMTLYSYTPGPATLRIGAREPARVDAIEVIKTQINATPHQRTPLIPEPNDARPIDINPPTFRWLHQGPGVTYHIQVAGDEAFNDIVVQQETTDTFLRPLKPLNPGKYWWRMRSDQWDEDLWAAPQSFEIDETVAQWPLPEWEETFSSIPEGRPRIYLRPEEVDDFRQWARGDGQECLQRVSQQMERQIGAEMPLKAGKEREGGLSREASVVRRVTFKKEAGRTAGPMASLALVYLATGEKRFAEELKRRALFIASLDPKGYASHYVSDFGNANLVNGLAYAYDYLYDYLTEDERKQIREALTARLEIMARSYRPGLEQRSGNAHAWQLIFYKFIAGCLAIHDESPQAREWLEWGVRLTVAMYPWFGGADGGSAECASYFAGTNLASSMLFRDIIHAATGVELCNNPWYEGNIYYTIFSHPPDHMRSQFGDHPGGPSSGGPGGNQYLVQRYRAALLDNPFAAAYAEKFGGEFHSTLMREYRWLSEPMPEPEPLMNLPDAMAFEDIGTVFAHSAIDRPESNIFFEFKSSPYGSHGHSHNDQNTFNLAAFNEPLLIDTGYYHSYGDDHHAGWTMRTKAHNCILVDGTGQPNSDSSAYGRLIDFQQGEQFMYSAGEAKWAYTEVDLSRFTRHCLWLKPDLFFIYDQLEAPEEHTYQYLLHAVDRMGIDEGAQRVDVRGEKGACRVTLLEPTGLEFSQTDVFDPPAKRWRDDRPFEMPNQWHLTAETPQPDDSMRFLSTIEVGRADEDLTDDVSALSGEGWTGVKMQRDDSTVYVGFARGIAPIEGLKPQVQMNLGDFELTAFAAAVEMRDGEAVRMIAISD